MNKRQIKGKLVTESFNYDGGRQVTVYIPPGAPAAIVYCGDGQRISKWGGLLESSNLPPTMIVGVHGLQDEELRLNEYSPGFAPSRFAEHEKFFVEDVRLWVRLHFNLKLTAQYEAIFGVSAGGELALSLGLKHPDIFGSILCASPGAGYKPPDVMPATIPQTYLVAGKQEPFFLKNALRWAKALDSVGANFVMRERIGEHGGLFWQKEFPLMVAWAFGY